MKCGYCGKPLKGNAKFCTYCGRSISSTSAEADNSSAEPSGSFLIAKITLILVVITILAGCAGLALNGILDWNTSSKNYISFSDTNQPGSTDISASDATAADKFVGDPALLGKWRCSDKAAAGYSDVSDYGISTQITIKFNKDGTFELNYTIENTGIQVRDITLTGKYSVNSGSFTLFPNLSTYNGDYFDTQGESLSAKYSAAADALKITTADDQQFVFTAA